MREYLYARLRDSFPTLNFTSLDDLRGRNAPSDHPVVEILGRQQVFTTQLRNERGFAESIRKGLPLPALDRFMARVGLTAPELAGPLGISVASIRRRHKRQRLTPMGSDRLYQLVALVALANETFADRCKAMRWLRKPNRSLDGDSPLSRLDNSIGCVQVERLLGRLEHAVPS